MINVGRAETRTLIGGGGGIYSYIHVLPDGFLFKLINLNFISKETRRAEHECMNIPPLPINVLVSALNVGTIHGAVHAKQHSCSACIII